MAEKEMRAILRELCDELDRRARQLLLPAVIGVGIAAAAGCGDSTGPQPAYAVPAYGVQIVDRGVPKRDAGRREVSSPMPDYMAVQPDAK